MGILLVVTGVGTIVAANATPKIEDSVTVNGIPVGGLTVSEAAYKVRVWWESEKRVPLKLVWKDHDTKFPSFTASKLGVTVDDAATVRQLPTQSPLEMASSLVGRKGGTPQSFPILLKAGGLNPAPAYREIEAALPKSRPARLEYTPHQPLKTFKEISSCILDKDQMLPAVSKAVQANDAVELPIGEGDKHVPDAELAKITDYISSYTTRFRKSQVDRDHNITNAAKRINGTVLMPGDVFSFNQTVGQRTTATGFKPAPVFVNGGHGVGIGGGICQVSTTLYNATLLGNLKILARQNHSLPVGYIPLGRDATVDWGAIDFKFQNTTSAPIAIAAICTDDTLSFYVFGQKQPGITVKIERGPERWVSPPVRYVTDKSLKPGQTRVISSGRSGRQIKTWRLVYKDGKLIDRQYLGQSSYRMEERVIARGPAAPTAPTLPPAGQGPPTGQGTVPAAP